MESDLLGIATEVVDAYKADHPEYYMNCYQARPEVIFLKMSKPGSITPLTVGQAIDIRKYVKQVKTFRKIVKMSLNEMKGTIDLKEMMANGGRKKR